MLNAHDTMQFESSSSTTPDRAALRERLRHVYWIGGGSGAGKLTIARVIAAQHGLHLYVTDDMMADHARRSTSESAPLLHRFVVMTMDQRWVSRPPSTMLETFHWFPRLDVPVIEVDTSMTEDDLAQRVAAVFGL